MPEFLSFKKSIKFLKPIVALYYIYVVTGILPVITYIVSKYQKKIISNKVFNFLFIFSIQRLVTDILAIYLSFQFQNSFPAIHISVFLSFIFGINIFNKIRKIKILNLLYFIGLFVFIMDLTISSTIFKSCIFSSITTFTIIITLCIQTLQLENISIENEKITSTFFIFYLTAFAYYLFQDLMAFSNKIMFTGFSLFILVNILFNFSITHIIWSKRKT